MKLTLINDQASAVPPNYNDVLRAICESFGLSHATYGCFFPDKEKFLAFTTFPDSWQHYYTENNLIEVDPTIGASFTSVGPIDWATLKDHPNFDRVFDAAEQHGVPRNGVAVPVRGPTGDFGAMSFCQHCTEAEWQRLLPSRLPNLMLTAAFLHESVAAHVHGLLDHQALPRPSLNPSEINVLYGLNEGFTVPEICAKLGISNRTFETHLRSARVKLRAITIEHAIARARAFEFFEDEAVARMA